MIHIDTIYESEAFRLLHQGMKDKHAVGVVYALMCAGNGIDREFELWCTERLQEQDDERAEWEARLMEEVNKKIGEAQKRFETERAAWEAERAKPHTIGDVMAELVFKANSITNLSDLQRIFDITEKLLTETSLRLANETHQHNQTKDELLRVAQENKATIHKLTSELTDAHAVANIGGYVGGEKLGTVLRSLFDRVDRLKEEMGIMEADYMKSQNQVFELQVTLGETETISARAYLDRYTKVHTALFHDDPTDMKERRDRHAEEGIELAQALGMPKHEFIKLAEYVYAREVGNVEKEIADSFTTLVAIGEVAHLNVFSLGLRGLKNLEKPETQARIREKRRTRHGRGPLPGFDPKKEPQTIGEVMKSRDFSTGEPKRSIIGDNDGPWELPAFEQPATVESSALHIQRMGRFVRPVHVSSAADVLVQSLNREAPPIPTYAGEIVMVKPARFQWDIGTPVKKRRGSKWRGHVVGFYAGSLTSEGYAVESVFEPGNVQVYPVAALEYADGGH